MPGWNHWFSIVANVAWKSTVVLGAAWLITIVLRKRSAAARHVVWTAASAAILALPLLSISLPSLRIPAPRSIGALNTGLVFRVLAIAGEEALVSAAPAVPAKPGQPARRAPDLRTVLMLVWATGAALSLVQMALGYAAMARMRKRSRPVDSLVGEVPVLETAAESMPVAFGIRRPVIFLPADAVEWTEERRRIVLMHELAHVWRGDTATHLLARAALALNWWNPLAWFAWREFLKERERAADDIVLESGAQASAYATHLLEVARSLQTAHAGAWAAVAMARRSQLEGRLMAILDSRISRKAAGRAALVCAAVLAVVLTAPFAAIRAQQATPEIDATISAANAQKNHDMLENAASAYENLRQYDAAQKLLESALAIRGSVSGEQSPDYQIGLMKLGDLAQKRGKFGEAREFYTKAVALGDRAEIAPALLFLGRNAASGNPERAIDLLQRAVNVNTNGPTTGPAYTWMAMARDRQDPAATDTEYYFQRGLNAEDPKSTDAATTMELYSQYLKKHERTSESEMMWSRAREIRASQRPAQPLRPQDNAPGSGPLKVGAGVTAPKLIYKVEPSYTEEARAAKYQGTSILSVEVAPDGLAHNIQVKQALGLGLDEMAIEAVSQWQFQPGTKDGQPVTVQATIEINFRLM
jgi:TonB family protein